MIKAGIDIGAKNIKAVITKDNIILAKNICAAGIDLRNSLEETFDKAVKDANIAKNDIEKIVATGVAADLVTFATDRISIVSAISRAGVYFFPLGRTVVDVGAEEMRVAKCDEKGNIQDFVLNDKCAAGAGLFLEAISRALEIKVEEMGQLSLKTQNTVPINTQCVIFAESEVVSLIHRKIPKEDIVRSVYDSMTNRVYPMMSKLGIKEDVVLVGGVANDIGFIESLKRKMGIKLLVPKEPEFAGAIGASLSTGKQEY